MVKDLDKAFRAALILRAGGPRLNASHSLPEVPSRVCLQTVVQTFGVVLGSPVRHST